MGTSTCTGGYIYDEDDDDEEDDDDDKDNDDNPAIRVCPPHNEPEKKEPKSLPRPAGWPAET